MKLLFQWLLLLVASFSMTSSIAPHKIPRLSPIDPSLRSRSKSKSNTISSPNSNGFETFFYNQTLDHFNYKPESFAIFKQRYVINSKSWGGAKNNAPIFAYLGAEGPLDGDVQVIGFINQNAPRFKALAVYIEHRFYGESNPLGSMEKSVKNKRVRGYFNSAQAIADYAEILLYIKKKLRAPHSPIIVIGGSYGGMLASWFRLKYPHVALGALASSAPILYFDNITPQDGYYSKVSKDFKDVSESCFKTIKKSWDEIDRVASKPNGLLTLSQKFKTCTPLKSSSELKDYLDTMYCGAAQYNAPPRYPTTQICQAIDGAHKAADILDQIFAGLVAYRPNRSCYDTTDTISQTSIGWQWQTCSEMVMPIGISSNGSMFPTSPYHPKEAIEKCKTMFNITPRPHWATTYYGGHDINLVLSNFGSNIIFSNGLKDPYSTGGVLKDLSDTLLAVHTTNGSHCLDILNPMDTDPEWLIAQRKVEVKIIQGWFKKYYHNLSLMK